MASHVMRLEHRRLRQGLLLVACAVVAGPATFAPASAQVGVMAAVGSDLADEPAELTVVVAEREEQRLAERLRKLAADREVIEQRILVRGRVLVRWLRNASLSSGNGVSSLMDHAVRVEALRRALLRDVQQQARLDAVTKQLNMELQLRQRQRARLRSELTDYRRSKEAILAAKEREQAYQRAFGSAPSGRHAAVYGSLARQTDVGSFAELRGRLPFPVHGRAEVIGAPPSDEHGAAVRLRVPPGGIAYSVYSGRVALIGDYKGLGRGVIIEHGDGYVTLTANLSNVEVQVGQRLAAGAPLGAIRSNGEHASLHFELRYQGQNLVPEEWFGL